MKYLGNCWTDLCQIHMEDMFGASLGRVWMSRSKVKVNRDKVSPHWKCIVTRMLQITSCSSRRDHSIAARGWWECTAQLHVIYVWQNIFSSSLLVILCLIQYVGSVFGNFWAVWWTVVIQVQLIGFHYVYGNQSIAPVWQQFIKQPKSYQKHCQWRCLAKLACLFCCSSDG